MGQIISMVLADNHPQALGALRRLLEGVAFHRELRRELAGSGFEAVANLLLMGILLDGVFQWVLLGSCHPGAALVVGPVLIMVPYVIGRSFSNRLAR